MAEASAGVLTKSKGLAWHAHDNVLSMRSTTDTNLNDPPLQSIKTDSQTTAIEVVSSEQSDNHVWVGDCKGVITIFNSNCHREALLQSSLPTPSPITDFSYCSGNSTMYVSDGIGTVWCHAAQKPFSFIRKLGSHLDSVTQLHIPSLNNNLVISSSLDTTLRFWGIMSDVNNCYKSQTAVGHTHGINCVASDNKTIAWSAGDEAVIREWNFEKSPTSPPQCQSIIRLDEGGIGRMLVFRSPHNYILAVHQTGAVRQISFSENGLKLLQVISIPNANPRSAIHISDSFSHVMWSASGSEINKWIVPSLSSTPTTTADQHNSSSSLAEAAARRALVRESEAKQLYNTQEKILREQHDRMELDFEEKEAALRQRYEVRDHELDSLREKSRFLESELISVRDHLGDTKGQLSLSNARILETETEIEALMRELQSTSVENQNLVIHSEALGLDATRVTIANENLLSEQNIVQASNTALRSQIAELEKRLLLNDEHFNEQLVAIQNEHLIQLSRSEQEYQNYTEASRQAQDMEDADNRRLSNYKINKLRQTELSYTQHHDVLQLETAVSIGTRTLEVHELERRLEMLYASNSSLQTVTTPLWIKTLLQDVMSSWHVLLSEEISERLNISVMYTSQMTTRLQQHLSIYQQRESPDVLLTKHQLLTSEYDELSEKYKTLLRTSSDPTTSSAADENKKLKLDLQQSQMTLSNLTKDYEDLTLELEIIRNKSTDEKTNTLKLQQQLDDCLLKLQSNTSDDKYTHIVKRHDLLKTDYNDAMNELSDMNKQNRGLQTTNSDISSQLLRLKSQLEETDSKHNQEGNKIRDLEDASKLQSDRIGSLNKDISELETDISQLRREKRLLNDSVEDSTASNKRLEAQLSTTQLDANALENEVTTLKGSHEDCLRRYQQTTAVLSDLELKYSHVEAKSNAQGLEILELEKENSTLKKGIHNLTMNADESTESQSRLAKTTIAKEQEINQLTERVASLQQIRSSSEEELKTLQRQIQQSEAAVETLKKEVEKLSNQNTILTKSNSDLETTNSELLVTSEQLPKTQRELSSVTIELQNCQSELLLTKKQLSDYEIQNFDSTISVLSEELQTVRELNSKLESQCHGCKIDFEKTEADLQSTKTTLEKTSQSLNSLQEQFDTLQSENQSLSSQNSDLKSKIIRFDDLTNDHSELTTTSDGLRKQLTLLQQEHSVCKIVSENLRKTEQQLQNCSSDNESLTSELSSMKVNLSNASNELCSHKDTLTSLNSQLQQERNLTESLRSRVQKIAEEQVETTSEMSTKHTDEVKLLLEKLHGVQNDVREQMTKSINDIVELKNDHKKEIELQNERHDQQLRSLSAEQKCREEAAGDRDTELLLLKRNHATQIRLIEDKTDELSRQHKKELFEQENTLTENFNKQISDLKEINQREHTTLSNDLKEIQQQLRKTSLDCNTTLQEAEIKHSTDVQFIKNSHIKEIDELTEDHRKNVIQLKNNNAEEVTALVEQLHSIQREIKQQMSLSVTSIEEMSQKHSSSITEAKRSHDAVVAELEAEYQTKITSLKGEHCLVLKQETDMLKQQLTQNQNIAARDQQNAIDDLSKQHEEEKKKNTDTITSSLNTQISILQKEVQTRSDNAKERELELENEISDLRDEMKKGLEAAKQTHRLELSQQTSDYEEQLNNQKSILSSKISQLESNNESSLQTVNEESNTQIDLLRSQLKLESETHQQQLQDLREESSAMLSKLRKEHENEITELTSKYKETLLETSRDSSCQQSDFSNSISKLRKSHQEELSELSQNSSQLRHQHTSQIEQLTTNHSEALSKIHQQHESRITEITTQLTDKHVSESSLLKDEINTLQQTLKTESAQLSEALGESTSIGLKSQNALKKSHQQEIDSFNNDIRSIHKKHAEEIQQIEDSHFEEVTQLRGEINRQKASEQELLTESRAVQRELQIHKKNISESQLDTANQINSLQSENEELRQANVELHDDNTIKNNENGRLLETEVELRSQTTSLLEELQNLQNDVTSQLQDLDSDLRETKSSHAVDIENQTIRNKELSDTVDLLQQNQQSLEAELITLRPQGSALNNMISLLCPQLGISNDLTEIEATASKVSESTLRIIEISEIHSQLFSWLSQRLSLTDCTDSDNCDEVRTSIEEALKDQQQHADLVKKLTTSLGHHLSSEDQLCSTVDTLIDKYEMMVSEQNQLSQIKNSFQETSEEVLSLRETCETSASAIQKLKTSMSELEEEKSILKSEAESLSEKIKTSEDDNRILLKQISDLKSAIETSESHLQSNKDSTDHLKVQLNTANDEISDLSETTNSQKDQLAELKRQLDDQQTNCERQSRDIEEKNTTERKLKDKIKELKIETEDFQTQLISVKRKLDDEVLSTDKLTRQLEDKNSIEETLSSELKDHRERLSSLEKDIADKSRDLQGKIYQIEKLNRELANTSEIKDSYEQQVTSLKEEIQNLSKQNSEFTSIIMEIKRQLQQQTEVSSQRLRKLKELEDIQQQFFDLSQKFKNSNDTIDDQSSVIKSLQRELSASVDENERHQTARAKDLTDGDLLLSELKMQSRTRICSLEDEYHTSKKLNKELTTKVDLLTHTEERLTSLNERLQQEFDQSIDNYKKQSQTLSIAEQELGDLKRKFQQKESDLTDENRNSQKAKDTIELLEQNIQSLRQRVAQQEDEQLTLKREANEMKDEKYDSQRKSQLQQSTVKDLQEANDVMRKRVSTAEDELLEFKKQFIQLEEANINYERTLSSNSKSTNELEISISKLREKILILQENVQMASSKLQSKEKELASANDSLERMKSQSDESIRQTKEELQAVSSSYTLEESELRDQLHSMLCELQSTSDKCSALNDDNKIISKNLTSEQESSSRLEIEHGYYQSTFEFLRDLHTQAIQYIEFLSAELRGEHVRSSTLERENSNLNDELKSRSDSLEHKYAAFEEQIQLSEEKMALQRLEHDNLTRKLELETNRMDGEAVEKVGVLSREHGLEIQKKENELCELQAEFSIINMANDDNKIKITDLEEQLSDYIVLQTTNKESQEAVSSLSAELHATQQQLRDRLQSEHSSLSDINDCNAHIHALEDQLSDTQNQLRMSEINLSNVRDAYESYKV